jgi:enamine deaminase RidA (YjgF/YER057c/UK114 family)
MARVINDDRDMPIHHQVLDPPGLTRAAGYAHAVVSNPGRLVFVAGQVSEDEDGNIVNAGDLHAQTQRCLRNVERALKAAGATFDDLVKVTWYMTDMRRIDELRAARTDILGTRRVASTVVQVIALYRPELLVEVEAIAVVPM